MADASLHTLEDIWHCRHLRPFKRKKNRDISTLDLAGVPCFVKRYRNRGKWRLPWSGAEGSEVEWAGAGLLRRAGLGTFEPVAVGADGSGRSLLVVTAVRGERLEDLLPGNLPFETKLSVVRKLADFAGRFHGMGLTHQDFYLCHLFWEGERGEIAVIDLQRLRSATGLVIPWIAKDLAELLYSARQFLDPGDVRELSEVFWQGYTELLPALKTGKVLRMVEKRAARIARHDKKLRKRAMA
jgi:tRNA A-37 threonylcarbamoyl transferase component Bud32